MKNPRFVLVLLALAALAATGFSTANSQVANDCCSADCGCCSPCGGN